MSVNRIVILMLLRPLCILLSILYATAALAQGTPQGLNALGSAGSLSTTDTIPVCQNSGGCGTSTPLKSATGSQISAFIASQGLTPAAGTCIGIAGWNVCAPSGATTSEADTAMLTTAFANALAQPVWLSAGVYYSCGTTPGPASVVRGGNVAGPGGWVGVGAPGSVQINPEPYMGALIYCANAAAVGPIFKVHDNTSLKGFAIQGNNGLGGNMTCVSAINTVAHIEQNMQYIGCGLVTNGGGLGRTTGLDLSSSSTPGDQGTITQGTQMDWIGCFYTGHCVYQDNTNGGNGLADFKLSNFECEATHDDCVSLNIASQGQIHFMRSEDISSALFLKAAGPVLITNTHCHLLPSNYCLKLVNFPGSQAVFQVMGLISVSTVAGPDVYVAESASGGIQLFMQNIAGSNGFGSLQYVTNAGAAAGRYIQVDTTVGAFDTASKAIILGGQMAGPFGIYNSLLYGYTLAAGTLQLFSCTSGKAGITEIVTDYPSSYPAVDTTATIGTGGGTVAVPLVCNGSNWKSR
jgi:hypothetical protein